MHSLDVVDGNSGATLRNGSQDLVALLDIDDRCARWGGFGAILGVSRARESDSAKVGEGNESSVLLEVLGQKSAFIQRQSDYQHFFVPQQSIQH